MNTCVSVIWFLPIIFALFVAIGIGLVLDKVNKGLYRFCNEKAEDIKRQKEKLETDA